MLALLKTGGNQYLAREDEVIKIKKIAGKPGDIVYLKGILFNKTGADNMNFTKEIEAQIVSQEKAKKILVFKKKRRKGYHKLQGYRQRVTFIKIKL